MAFRRKRFFKKGPRRFFNRRPLARVRRTWITSFNKSACDPLNATCSSDNPVNPDAPLACCSVGLTLVLVDNPTLESVFSDQARVKRVLGDLWFLPLATPNADPPTCLDTVGSAAVNFWQGFVGLRKYQLNPQGNSPTNPYIPRPLSGPTAAIRDYDLSESEWKKTWQHFHVPQDITADNEFTGSLALTFPTVCADVHTAGALDNDFVDGTGTINIETTCNDPVCTTCPQDTSNIKWCTEGAANPQPWHLHVDWRRTLSLREDEEFSLQAEFVFPFGASPDFTFQVQVIGNLRTLVQMG